MQDRLGRFVRGTHWREPKPHWDREWLFREYVSKKRSAAEIAIEVECKENNIHYWLKKHGIPTRTVSEVRAMKHWGASGEKNPMHGKYGALNPRYVDGSSPERQRLYAQGHGKAFLRLILKRDSYRCQRCMKPKCGGKGLHVHHLRSWAGNPSLRFDPENAITLCSACHAWVHSKKNTNGDFIR